MGAEKSEPPTSSRAESAAARVRPRLNRELRAKDLHWGDPVFLRVIKDERTLELWIRHRSEGRFRLFKSYPIAAQSGHPGPKLAEGDNQVPEGFYAVSRKDLNPQSNFHLSFNIGYPNEYDRHHGRDGTFIMVHGGRVSIGCLAMTDPGIEEIYSLCAAALEGDQDYFRVHIFPFRMTEQRMRRAGGHRWEDFWKNLKTGYDWFESRHRPPDVILRDGRYHFRTSR